MRRAIAIASTVAEAQQLKRLQDDKTRAEADVERTKTILKTSEAAKEMVDFVVSNQKKDPFVNASIDQPYTKKPGGGGGNCTLF